jgi:outer membrane protein assembly factor BamB/tetratricopeptide (TPR) repeat protein
VTPLVKGGSSLVALDEITGQIRWSYGPMSASDGDESLMRFECAPAGGPGTIYANYVLDNIKGDTHIDSEFGVIAFESTTGRVKWRRQVCRLQPGKFDGSFGTTRRNRIRSFFSPPLYHEGTIYVSPNAGAIAAMDSLSGRIKWLMRYPYYPGAHDLTRTFGNTYEPSLFYNQRPLVVGEQIFVLPVNCPWLICLDRKTGKVNWTFNKPTRGFGYLLGPLSTGEMVMTGNGRSVPDHTGNVTNPIYLFNPKDGKVTWRSPDYVKTDSQPVMSSNRSVAWGIQADGNYFESAARPFLSEDDKIIMTGWNDQGLWWRPGMYIFALGEIDLKNRKLLGQRRYYTGALLAHANTVIYDATSRGMNNTPLGAPLTLEELNKVPRKNKQQEEQTARLEAIIKDTVPVNEHPAFMPFSRITFTRYGIPFELRLSPRNISMIYKRKDLEAKTKDDNSLMATFGKSELSIKDGDYKKASEYLNQCLTIVSPEDVNFRGLIKQQFYKVYLELVRSAIRSNKPKQQMENSIGMSNTASVLAEEVETLFALAEAYQANGNPKSASQCLRTLIEVYGHHEYPISSIVSKAVFFPEEMNIEKETLKDILTDAKSISGGVYNKEATTAIDFVSKSTPLYLSSVSPLPKELYVRTGDLAILKLIGLIKNASGFEAEYSKLGESELVGEKIDQLLYHIWKYPGTSKGQETFARVCKLAAALPEEERRDAYRKLGHVAKICKFKLPSELTSFFMVPATPQHKEINPANGDKVYEVGNFKDGIMITLEREGDISKHPNLLFLSVKLPKKVGFRFSVVCFDLSIGKEVWRKDEFRLKDLGKEPGFYKAFVYQDIVVVNGMYDVFGFNIKDGVELWHYKTPHSFEIYEAEMSGNIIVLSGANETIALQVETQSPIGEVAWQQKEDGNIYYKPYFVDDVFVSVRKYPFNITSRYRTTGSLISRMALPDLSEVVAHPILKDVAADNVLPISHFGRYLAATDEKYLLVYDVVKMELMWKTPLSNVDPSKDLKMRIALNDKYITLIKEDFDRKAIYCYSLDSGDILWNTDPTNSGSPQPIYSIILEGDMLYGIGDHPGQGFRFVSYDCVKGKKVFDKLIEGYSSPPIVRLRNFIYGKHVVVELQDRKNFEAIVLDKNTGALVKKIEDKGDGPIGEIGRVSIAVQNGYPVLFSKVQFKY